MPGTTCKHIDAVTSVRPPKAHVCDECVTMGGAWVTCAPARNAVARAAATTRRTGTRRGTLTAPTPVAGSSQGSVGSAGVLFGISRNIVAVSRCVS